MKILFSPSETKKPHKVAAPLQKNAFIFPSLYEKRHSVLNRYQILLDTQNMATLQTLFGLKDEKKCLAFSHQNIFLSSTCKAVQRYDGTAYQYLDFDTLPQNEQQFIENNVIIFSNLFGPLGAGDFIPEYKLQQGATLDGFKPEGFFKEYFSDALDAMFQDEFIIDLRASFYEKFYTLKQPYVMMKFLKNGKIVSHFAKAYRGKILRELSFHQPQNEADFGAIAFENLKIVEIVKTKLKSEYVFEIIV